MVTGVYNMQLPISSLPLSRHALVTGGFVGERESLFKLTRQAIVCATSLTLWDVDARIIKLRFHPDMNTDLPLRHRYLLA
jgi:hypothetical protein